MAITAVLMRGSNIYHHEIETGQEVSIGSHKKDDMFVEDFAPGQIVIKWKKGGISVNAKKAYDFDRDDVPMDTLIVLDDDTKTVLYLNSLTAASEKTIKLPYNCILKFGRSSDNDVVIGLPFVSSHHFILKNEAGNVRVEDQESTNGLFLNGKKVNIARMRSGDVLSVLSVQIQLLNGVLYFENVGDRLSVRQLREIQSVNTADGNGNKLLYHRSPRTQDRLPSEDIVLANAPNKAQKFEKSRGMFASLAGTGAMFAANMVTAAASPALLAARAASLVSPITSVAGSKGANKKRKTELEQYEAMRREKYGAYISDQKARIESVARVQRDIITDENPAPKECINILYGLSRKLWERKPFDRDFLDLRVGMGYEDLCVSVKSRADSSGFQMEDDEIRELSEQIIEETRIVDNVPARISLMRKNTIGFIGDRGKTVQLVRNMLIALTTEHCFEEVRIVGIFDRGEEQQWNALRWLPHVWDENRQFRTLAFERKEAHALCEMFGEMLKKRREELSESAYSKKPVPSPFYIFIFGSKDMVEKEEIMQELFTNDPSMGVTTLFLFDEMYMLPPECQCIVDVDNGPTVFDRDEANNKSYFTMDPKVDDALWDAFARRMSAVELEGFSARSGLPGGITFLQGYGVKTVEQLAVAERWNSSVPYKSLAAPIGIMSGDKPFYLDIHEKRHGPHGLVAGTTGSGKSELLLTYILSMCLCYHPDDVNFVIIDYKGGGMANLLEKLPHVVGKITNIGSNIDRALISFHSELKRRERIFESCGLSETGKVNIYRYQEAYKNKKVREVLPHLIIVADEFAELKRERPEFMADLNGIARVGRELGIHLVLATQKPGGVVDEQIQSNSRFRLCLKVQDVNDSREMIKRPDAAKITQAGRCYIRVGEDEYFDLFQSFWSGAPYFGATTEERGNQVRIVELSGKRLKTVSDEKSNLKSDRDELTAVVEYIGRIADENNIRRLSGPWLPELPERLYVDEISFPGCFDGDSWNSSPDWLKIPIGMYDAPKLQEQGVQHIDLASEGHFGIYGAPGTGKTTLLKTAVLSLGLHYSPRDVNIYILDCGGWSMSVFANMPHVGGVALDGEDEKFSKFEKLILQELENRKRRFLQNSVGSLSAYRESVSSDMPAIIIAIDNIAPVFELYPDMENLLVTVARDGATYGIYLIYTANSTSSVRYKVLQNVRGAAAFELTDKGDYITIVGRLDGMTLPKIAGRAFFKGNPPLEFQAATFAEGENERERISRLKGIMSEMNSAWHGPRPKPIPVMPETVTRQSMESEYSLRTVIPVGIGCEDIRPAFVDLTDRYSMIVTGSVGSGKSRRLAGLVDLMTACFPETRTFVFDSAREALHKLANKAHRYAAVSETEQVSDMLAELVAELNRRKKAQNEARQIDAEVFNEKEFIERYELLCIVIDDLKEFVDSVSNADKNSMERICRMAQDLGVAVLCAGRMSDIAKYNEIESLTRVIVGNQNGIVLDGTPAQHAYFRNDLKYSDRDETPGEGLSYLFLDGKCTKIKLMQ